MLANKLYKTTVELIKDSDIIDSNTPDEVNERFDPDLGDAVLLNFKKENNGVIKMLNNELYLNPDSDEDTADTNFVKLLVDNDFVLDIDITEQRRVIGHCYMGFWYKEFSHKDNHGIKIGLFSNHDGTSGGVNLMFMNNLGAEFIKTRFQSL